MFCGLIGLDADGGEDGGEEEECAEFLGDEHGAFSLPPEAGFGGEVAFEDGAGVDVGALDSAEGGEVGFEGAKAGFEEVVIIEVECVGCDASWGQVVFVLSVGGGEGDDGLDAGQDVSRVGSAFGSAFEPFHFPVATVGNPGFEGVGVWGAGGFGEADGGEA